MLRHQHRTYTRRAVQPLLVVAALGAIAYATVRLAPSPTDRFPIADFGAAPEATQTADPVRPERAVGAASTRQSAIDYFPDHYRNQATKEAEPVETF
jgi:hypothetical protein